MTKTRLLIITAALTVLALACSSLGPLIEEPLAPVLPGDTPAPPLPTNTWPPSPTDPPPSPTDPPPSPTDPPPPEPTAEPTPVPAEPTRDEAKTLFADDFSDPESGWDRYHEDQGFADYENGSYKFSVYQDSIMLWGNPYQYFGDVAIEVISSKLGGGDDVQYGIICRYQDKENFYALLISADGYAAIRNRFQGGEIDYIAEWTNSPVINQGNATNLLRAECVGNRLSLYANGVLLLEAFDSSLPSGDAGLLAGTFSATEVEILFDNFIVSAP